MRVPHRYLRLVLGLAVGVIAASMFWFYRSNSTSILTRELIARMSHEGQLTLYSLEPTDYDPPDDGPLPRWHGWVELGSTTFEDESQRRSILEGLLASIAAGDNSAIPGCFWPRHGIRWECGSEVVDIEICFECTQLLVHQGSITRHAVLRGASSLPSELNDLLRRGGVPLATPAKDELQE